MMLKFDVITLFPNLFEEHLENLPYKRAIEKEVASINLVDLKNFAIDKRGTVDGKTYGGGTGMIIRPEPVFDAENSIKKEENSKTVLLSPRGKIFDQQMANQFSKLDQLILISGRYEGIDARVEEHLADEVVSIGNYILSGGELAALVIMESVIRLLPGILEKEDATKIESFSDGKLEYSQYTRPEEYMGMKVPEVLLSGNHKEIKKWREENKKPTR